ncbi:hypothetical protein BASA81_003823 [Batrachochytrium salamandrivorans]|nr:hypothetical protein BASA81_003823 [Batrachochytrium salamandrivorans]
MLRAIFLIALLSGAITTSSLAARPHLVVLVADDFGYGNLGYHRADANTNKEVITPNLDSLASEGVKLERFYTYHICSPSRSSLQSGRLPVHVNTENIEPTTANPRDPLSGYAGIPRNMTCIAEKLKQLAGYRTVFTGKWDAGMATPRHTPRGRGYDEFFGYFHHANDYWTAGLPITSTGAVDLCANRFLDLWKNDGPAVGLAGTAYEEELFENHTIEVIQSHQGNPNPLFLMHSFHLVHTPLQVPQAWQDKFSFIEHKNRRKYAAMVSYMDASVGRIVDALKRGGLYDNTLVLFFSDNGGPIYNPGSASNHPLRGGKYSEFEGGVRTNAFASGGIIPPAQRGQTSHDLIHVADVYASLIRVAMFDLKTPFRQSSELAKLVLDEEAQRVGLPPVDSQNTLWGAIISSNQETTRQEVHLSEKGLISGRYKVLLGDQPMNMWQGEQYPNATGYQPSFLQTSKTLRSLHCHAGCLFNIFEDPTEHHELSAAFPELKNTMVARLRELNKSVFRPNRGREDFTACRVAKKLHQGHYGPFLDLPSDKQGPKAVAAMY